MQERGGNITTSFFAPKVDFPTLASVFPIAIGDMDGDGKLDLVVGCGNGSQVISAYRNTATPGSITTGSFAAHVDFAAPGWVNSVALADLDGDGKLDVAVASQLSSVFSIFKNVSVPGSFTTASLAARVDYPAGYNPDGVAIGDLDGDGRPDVVFANAYDSTISIYRNIVTFAASVTAPVPVITSFTPQSGAIGTAVTITGTNFQRNDFGEHRLFRCGASKCFVRQCDQPASDGADGRDLCADHGDGQRIDRLCQPAIHAHLPRQWSIFLHAFLHAGRGRQP